MCFTKKGFNMAILQVVLYVVAVVVHGATAAQWASNTLPEGQRVSVCVDDTATFTWDYLLSQGDSLGDVHWYYTGNSHEMVAVLVQGTFLPLPAFSQRVSRVGTAGMTVQKVVAGDSGNYSVEVDIYTNSGAARTVLRRTAVLDVSGAASLQTVDGSLHVRQNTEAVFDNATNQWALLLQCGVFKFVSNPPVEVEWVSPSGQIYNSNDYSNGYFNLLIPKPIPAGSFTCRLPARFTACLHGNAGHMDHAVLTVDSLEARMSIVEKENAQLRQQLTQCSSSCGSGTGANQGQDVRVDQLQAQLQHAESTLNTLTSTMNQANQQLESRLHVTESSLAAINAENQQIKLELITLNSTLTRDNQLMNSQVNSAVSSLNLSLNRGLASMNQELRSDLAALNSTLTHENQQLKLQLQGTTAQITQSYQNDLANLRGVLAHDVQILEGQLATVNSTLTAEDHHLKTSLDQTSAWIATETTNLQGFSNRLASVEARAATSVSFHARGLTTAHQLNGTPLILPNVVTNVGYGYSSSTGFFTANANGIYFFMGTTGPKDPAHLAGVVLVVDGTIISSSTAYDQDNSQQTSVQGVVQLKAGQRVWLKAWDTADYWLSATTFSGFLIHPDP